jgi:hypothetical protein
LRRRCELDNSVIANQNPTAIGADTGYLQAGLLDGNNGAEDLGVNGRARLLTHACAIAVRQGRSVHIIRKIVSVRRDQTRREKSAPALFGRETEEAPTGTSQKEL